MASGWGRIVHGPEEELRRFREEVSTCRLCTRCDSRSRVLPGFGPAKVDLVVLLPPPDEREELEDGLMLGEAGTMLDNMLQRVVMVERSKVYLMPSLFCRGAKPSAEEVNACRPLVLRQLAILRPKVVLAMGEEVLPLLGTEARRGTWLSWNNLDVMPTWHPNELIRDPTKKRPAMEHLKQAGERLAQVPLFGGR
jgi:DNA polymerase